MQNSGFGIVMNAEKIAFDADAKFEINVAVVYRI